MVRGRGDWRINRGSSKEEPYRGKRRDNPIHRTYRTVGAYGGEVILAQHDVEMVNLMFCVS